MTDKKRLIEDVLGGLKVPKKQTRQQKKSMKRSEKNIKKNLYDDVLKPLKNSGGGLTEGIKKVKAKTESMLSGGQAKLDKNKNNKIDAEDFKILRENKMRGGGIAIKGTKFKGVF
tara:strand:- start:3170 stop:3514 length:345 start_codon:yes stop_codon:yes gene_type:complete